MCILYGSPVLLHVLISLPAYMHTGVLGACLTLEIFLVAFLTIVIFATASQPILLLFLTSF